MRSVYRLPLIVAALVVIIVLAATGVGAHATGDWNPKELPSPAASYSFDPDNPWVGGPITLDPGQCWQPPGQDPELVTQTFCADPVSHTQT